MIAQRLRFLSLSAALAVAAACDPELRVPADSTRVDSAGGSLARDSVAGLDSLRGDSVGFRAGGGDSANARLFPPQPRRGGVLVAVLPYDSAAAAPRCTWKGRVTPCHSTARGVVALVPLPADDTIGTFELTVETPNARIRRQVTVAEHEFPRELILLSDSLHALVRRRADIARDARSVKQVLSTASPEQRWSGRWRDPARERETTSPYGVERFYARASDTTRSIPLGTDLRARGGFGSDTLHGTPDLPGWRHAGIDIARARRSVVPAPAAGIVADVGRYTLMGNTLLIDHGLGVFSAFFHLDTVLVRRGDLVRIGQDVARVGSTGLATGAHLHYGVYIHGRDVDPMLWHAAAEWLDGTSVAAQARDTSRSSRRADGRQDDSKR